MNAYNPNAFPDDPYRVAPPYCAPGEVEPPDVPQVSDAEAVDRVLDVLLSDNPKDTAFGETADDWVDWLHDFFISNNGSRTLFAAILDQTKPSLIPVLRREIKRFIGDHANNRLAEMSPEELERENLL